MMETPEANINPIWNDEVMEECGLFMAREVRCARKPDNF